MKCKYIFLINKVIYFLHYNFLIIFLSIKINSGSKCPTFDLYGQIALIESP